MAVNIVNETIVNEAMQTKIFPLWRMPFRPFFFAIALFSCLALTLWVYSFTHGVAMGGINYLWHLHEMIIGFAATTVVGFVLTASQTWTGVPTIKGSPLAMLFLVWLISRILWLSPASIQWLAAFTDLIFFAFVASVYARQILIARNWRNSFFIGVFSALSFGSGLYGFCLLYGDQYLAKKLLMVAFFIIIHVVLVIGGRVIPFFSDRGLQRETTLRPAWLELSALISSLLFLASYLFMNGGDVFKACAWAVVIFNSLRWLNWKPWQAARVPILWSLYVAYVLVIIGFAFMALSLPSSTAIHLLAIGGIGLMILAMISRVSLGHSGRPLVLPTGFWVAYCGVIVSVIARVSAPLLPGLYSELLWVALGGWVVGFGLFVLRYYPILWSPRVDGRPG